MFHNSTFHFVKKVNGKKYVTQIPVNKFQIQFYRMDLKEVDKILKEINYDKNRIIFLQLDPEELEKILIPYQKKLQLDQYKEEHLYNKQ